MDSENQTLFKRLSFFTELMRKSLSNDPVSPIVTDDHLYALDRRLVIILNTIRNCTKRRPFQDVIIMDSN